MSATITQYLENIIRNAQEITQSRDATDDIADAAAAIIGDIADLREHHSIEAQGNFDAAQKAGFAWMQRAVTAEDSADALAFELRRTVELIHGNDSINHRHMGFAAISVRLGSIQKTLNDYEKGRPK